MITHVNEEDMKERANAFMDEDEVVEPLVLGETYKELFENRKPPKERKPIPSVG